MVTASHNDNGWTGVKMGAERPLTFGPREMGRLRDIVLGAAFVTRPALLFADEPTGNLDTATGRSIVDQLFDLNSQQGTTLILVTHDERLAARCNRILRLAAGRLVEA